MGDFVLVIGAVLMDTKGKPREGLEPGTTNPSGIRSTRGGTARNVAENLARLGTEVILLSAVGDDINGINLLTQTAASGVNTDHVLTIEDEGTGAYIAILDTDGSLSVALDDVEIIRHIDSDFLLSKEELFAQASLIMLDGSLAKETVKTAVALATHYNIPLCADPSSARLVHRLRPYLSDLHLIVPNENEAAELLETEDSNDDPDATLELARQLVKIGIKIAVVTLPDFGIAYATPEETGYIPARFSEMIDSTGTGDAITAAIIFGILNELPTIEALRLGAAAAGLTLQTSETVSPELSLDALYDHLTV